MKSALREFLPLELSKTTPGPLLFLDFQFPTRSSICAFVPCPLLFSVRSPSLSFSWSFPAILRPFGGTAFSVPPALRPSRFSRCASFSSRAKGHAKGYFELLWFLTHQAKFFYFPGT